MAGIVLENVTKKFSDVPVMRDINLTIQDGEFFTFVGPSGCGKSTLLNMIAGLEPVTSGEIYFDGSPVNALSPGRRDVAMVFQNYALYPHMTVYENIAFPLRMRKVPKGKTDAEVKRVAALLAVEDLLQRKPKELSGGQRQRVALGRAIIRRPRVFLMDEPLSNLDARLRIDMRAELRKIHSELKITTVYVTHDQAEALSLSDRIAVLHRGEVQQCGTPFEVYLKPATVFVAGFIGSPPMNFLRCHLRKREPVEVDCYGILFRPSLEASPTGESATLGIRPEDITISAERSEKSIEGVVLLTEPAGSFRWVDLECGSLKVRGVAGLDESLKIGDHAFMKVSPERILLFEEGTGKRL